LVILLDVLGLKSTLEMFIFSLVRVTASRPSQKLSLSSIWSHIRKVANRRIPPGFRDGEWLRFSDEKEHKETLERNVLILPPGDIFSVRHRLSNPFNWINARDAFEGPGCQNLGRASEISRLSCSQLSYS
jgi:hypothetical protein